MRDKIVFFLLGAVLATFAYMAGGLRHARSVNEVVDKLYASEIFVDKLITPEIIVGEIGKESHVGIRVDENGVPSINLSNMTDGKTNSGILLSAFSDKDEVGSIPMFILIGKGTKETYTLTSGGVYRR